MLPDPFPLLKKAIGSLGMPPDPFPLLKNLTYWKSRNAPRPFPFTEEPNLLEVHICPTTDQPNLLHSAPHYY